MQPAAPRSKRVLIVASDTAPRRWQAELKARLEAAGHGVGLTYGEDAMASRSLDRLLALEPQRQGPLLAAPSVRTPAQLDGPADLVIDLRNKPDAQEAPVLTVDFAGLRSFEQGLASIFRGATHLEITVRLDGAAVAVARPMLDDRVWLSRVSNNVLSGAVNLLVQCVDRYFIGRLSPRGESTEAATPEANLTTAYLPALAAGLAQRLWRRLSRQRSFYWQVAYRQIAGPGVAETTALDGAPFTVLEDDGQRFYADPFVIERDGRHFLFVEEYPYATGRGVISMAELGDNDRFGVPRIVLEEPHHLSYPQVFAHEDEIFMLPESGGAGELVLYRADAFPDRWTRDTVLVTGRDLNDATLLIEGGRYWLFCTERSASGSASDTLAVFTAQSLRGPWQPHRSNPVAIDLTASRPGGAFISEGEGEWSLPVQDGRGGYGKGLGLMRLAELSLDRVLLDRPMPVRPGPAWPGRSIHTLNRAGRFEVVDSLGTARR